MASTGIEPVSGASEALILSIVLRGQAAAKIAVSQGNDKKEVPCDPNYDDKKCWGIPKAIIVTLDWPVLSA